MNYDIVGDIHGHAGKLRGLLAKLGYSERGGSWRHPSRMAIFVGDFIDRGPEQLATVDIARRMIDSGAALAVMGNHEFNAIAWHTPDPRQPGEFLRPRNSRVNQKQHEQFLAEVRYDAKLHAEVTDWFLTLPLWLDLPGLRVVHACWHAGFMAQLAPHLHQGKFLTRELMVDATLEPFSVAEKDDASFSVFKAVEAITKGIELGLPNGGSFSDKDGHSRDRVRLRWWDSAATDFRSAAMLPESQRQSFPASEIPAHARLPQASLSPVFFGHYWMEGVPKRQSRSAVCVDYSAGKGGDLVAYRWDGEVEPQPGKFVSA